MRRVFELLIDAPARLLGTLIGSVWPIIGIAGAIGVGVLVYRLVSNGDQRKVLALALSILVGVYAGMVLYQTQKWTAFAMLERYRGEV